MFLIQNNFFCAQYIYKEYINVESTNKKNNIFKSLFEPNEICFVLETLENAFYEIIHSKHTRVYKILTLGGIVGFVIDFKDYNVEEGIFKRL